MPTTRSTSGLQLLMASLTAVALLVAGCDASGSSANENNNDDENGDDGPTATFAVSVAEKTSAHPFSGQGFSQGYVVDGEQGKELSLTRGATYEFVMNDVPSIHPFYITTNATGQGQGEYSEGVENNGVTGSQTLTFTPPESAPDTLYYNCTNHAYMGGLIRLSDGDDANEGDPGY